MKVIVKFFVVTLLVASTSVASFAGPIRGPLLNTTRVQARSSDYYTEICRGGEWTTIAIVGDGDTDLDLYVYDAKGNIVVRSIGLSDRETVSFLPLVAGAYRIEVRNLGGVWNQYSIAMR